MPAKRTSISKKRSGSKTLRRSYSYVRNGKRVQVKAAYVKKSQRSKSRSKTLRRSYSYVRNGKRVQVKAAYVNRPKKSRSPNAYARFFRTQRRVLGCSGRSPKPECKLPPKEMMKRIAEKWCLERSRDKCAKSRAKKFTSRERQVAEAMTYIDSVLLNQKNTTSSM